MIENNEITSNEQAKKFQTCDVSFNRPSKRLWTDFSPFLYQCGNTYAMNLIESSSISDDNNNNETINYDIFLGGVCDIRHLLETCAKANELMLQNKNKTTTVRPHLNLNFHLNDVNLTNLTRIVVLLFAISRLNDDDVISRQRQIADILMLWSSPKIYKCQKEYLDKLLDDLEKSLDNFINDKQQSSLNWLCALGDDDLKVIEKIKSSIQLWRKYTFCVGSLFFHGHKNDLIETNSDSDSRLKYILHEFMGIDLDEAIQLECLSHGSLVYSSSIRSKWYIFTI